MGSSRVSVWAGLFLMAVSAAGCGEEYVVTRGSTGGAQAIGGAKATGGASATGGRSATGGAKATGGSATGGATGTGGARATGTGGSQPAVSGGSGQGDESPCPAVLPGVVDGGISNLGADTGSDKGVSGGLGVDLGDPSAAAGSSCTQAELAAYEDCTMKACAQSNDACFSVDAAGAFNGPCGGYSACLDHCACSDEACRTACDFTKCAACLSSTRSCEASCAVPACLRSASR